MDRARKRRATLVVRPHRALSAAGREAVAAEAERMVGFAAADAAVRDVRFVTAIP
ncbi:MAG TPA: hypothetical protein VES79_00915 [Solirubrobacteraceae bacterium]|nr:hypothetical protein [Solirubrobacteraceae bacterium]